MDRFLYNIERDRLLQKNCVYVDYCDKKYSYVLLQGPIFLKRNLLKSVQRFIRKSNILIRNNNISRD